MEPKLILSYPNGSYSSSVPLFLSQGGHVLERPKLSVKSHVSFSQFQLEKSQFWGKGLVFQDRTGTLGTGGGLRRTTTRVPFEPVRAAVKRRKERALDNVIERDKKLNLVLKIRKILVSQPDRIMSLVELGKHKRELGVDRKRRLIALLKNFPAVFEIVEKGAFSLRFKLTPEAERLYLEELKVMNGMEDLLVLKLRKLLMMSLDKRILLEKIAHMRTDLGLPWEFRDTICHRYPQYFRVVVTESGPALELTHWDPELAVSAAELSEEERQARELEERDLIIDRPMKFNRVKLPKGLQLSSGEMRRLSKFRSIPYISPYSDFHHLQPGTPQKERHSCGVVHEILSLTVEKRTLVDHLTHFREEFRFSQQVRGMLIRHPDMFYVSLKGFRDSVFLREAYQNSYLKEKDRRLLIKEKLRSLVDVPRFRGIRDPKNDTDGDDGTNNQDEKDEETEDWSDIDNFMNDDDSDEDDGDDFEDDWTDGEDDTPPDFNEDDSTKKINVSKSTKQPDNIKTEEKILTPVFPDGQPRERW